MKKKVKNNEKVKAKLSLAFFILYNFDLKTFHTKKSYEKQKQKIKLSLRLKIIHFKNSCKKYFFVLPQNEKRNKQKSTLLFTNFLINLDNFNKKSKDNNLAKELRNTPFVIFIKNKKNYRLLRALKFLEDFLKI